MGGCEKGELGYIADMFAPFLSMMGFCIAALLQAQAVFESFPLGVMRADMWRYSVIHAQGGIYADVSCLFAHAICCHPACSQISRCPAFGLLRL